MCRLVSGPEFQRGDSGWHGRHDYVEDVAAVHSFMVMLRYLGNHADVMLRIRFRPDVLINETHPRRLETYIGKLGSRDVCYIVNCGDLDGLSMLGDQQAEGVIPIRQDEEARIAEARRDEGLSPARFAAIMDMLDRAARGMDLRDHEE